ncbi:hypothetical protein L9F63_026419 [Diploptera punctata]|uniref:Uncharacterized protein n=1 Tax=Diploptera punctata TaxID=6984 RepID=A0AAD8AKB2_DIPPU|nr:hypothetical protein L9F63_008499 [Diploptera punctata]KAJ9599732.1 hypothetical protein L9F63_026419 [Diploptera punctata]
MASTWQMWVSGALLIFLPTVFAELRNSGAVEELDQGIPNHSFVKYHSWTNTDA